VASPLIANVYLHYLFDLWADVWRGKAAKGDVIVVRYADDLVLGFQHRADAERFLESSRNGWQSSTWNYIRTRHG
jgi:RNA-directed DNA polymerase